MPVDNKAIGKLRREYPNVVPLKVASPYLGMSARRLSELVAEGRKPYSLLGGNIGTKKRIVIIYTERLIAYVNGYPLEG